MFKAAVFFIGTIWKERDTSAVRELKIVFLYFPPVSTFWCKLYSSILIYYNNNTLFFFLFNTFQDKVMKKLWTYFINPSRGNSIFLLCCYSHTYTHVPDIHKRTKKDLCTCIYISHIPTDWATVKFFTWLNRIELRVHERKMRTKRNLIALWNNIKVHMTMEYKRLWLWNSFDLLLLAFYW